MATQSWADSTRELPALPRKPVPVLLTVRELHCGGIERDVAKIATHLDRDRFEPHVASYHAEGMRFDELIRAGIPVLHVPVSSLKSPSALWSAIRIERYIREHAIRLVHAYDSSAVFVVPIARTLGVPAVLSSTLGHRDLSNNRTRRQLRWTDKMVDTLTVNCEAMRRHMIDDERFPEDRIELCYNGVDTSQFYPTPRHKLAQIGEASLVIGSVAVLRREKALDLLQEAFALVRDLQSHLKLVLVGSGPELGRLEANSNRLGLQNDCVFVPATSSVAKYLRAFDIFVLCSRSEAFSNSLLEAMACGCPVVGSSTGGTTELIGNDERGLLFRSGDVQDLAEKLARMIKSDALRRQLGAAAAKFAKMKLPIEAASERMGKIYETTLRRKDAWPMP